MASFFNLPDRPSQLASSNPNFTRAAFRQFTASRDVTGDNFTQGNIQFRWMLGANTWFVPSMSYFRMRCTLTQVRHDNGPLAPILSSGDISPNMGLAANLFQSVEMRLNGVPIERVGERLPQIDALKTRLSKSKAWLDTVGASVNFWNHDHNRRKQHCAINGYMTETSGAGPVVYGVVYDGNTLDMAPGTHQVAYTTEDHLLTFTVNGGPPLDIAHQQVLRAGDLVSLGDDGMKLEIVQVLNALHAIARVVAGAHGDVDVENDTLDANQFSVQQIAHSTNNGVIPKNSFEIIWQPPLGFFEVTHAIPPGGNWTCEFAPENAGNFKKRVIESVLQDLNFHDLWRKLRRWTIQLFGGSDVFVPVYSRELQIVKWNLLLGYSEHTLSSR